MCSWWRGNDLTKSFRGWARQLVSLSLFVVGYETVQFVMINTRAADLFDEVQLEFRLWIVVLGAAVGMSLATAPHFFGQLRTLSSLGSQRFSLRRYVCWGAVVVSVLMVLYLSIGIAAGNRRSAAERALSGPVNALIVPAIILSIPGLLVFFALSALADSDDNWPKDRDSENVKLLLRLRGELRHVLALIGTLLTLLVISTGMRRRALLALDPTVSQPPELVLLYGLAFATILGVVFAKATSSISERTRGLIDDLAPLAPLNDGDLVALMSRRRELGSLLGNGGDFESFRTIVIIAGPLLTAIVGNALA